MPIRLILTLLGRNLLKMSLRLRCLLLAKRPRMTSLFPGILFLLLSVLSASLSSASSTGSIVSPISSLLLRSAPFQVSFFISLVPLPPLSLHLFSTLDSHLEYSAIFTNCKQRILAGRLFASGFFLPLRLDLLKLPQRFPVFSSG